MCLFVTCVEGRMVKSGFTHPHILKTVSTYFKNSSLSIDILASWSLVLCTQTEMLNLSSFLPSILLVLYFFFCDCNQSLPHRTGPKQFHFHILLSLRVYFSKSLIPYFPLPQHFVISDPYN